MEDGGGPGPLQRALHDPLRPPYTSGDLLRRASLPTHNRRSQRPSADEARTHIERFDSEYERGGVCWVLMSFEPLSGWRELVVTETPQKARVRPGDEALGRGTLPTSRERIRVVFRITSQLIRLRPSTRTLRWSLPATSWPEGSSFATPRCRARVAEHGGDRDISVLVRQCLKRRLPDTQRHSSGRHKLLCVCVCVERNRIGASVDWRFRTEDARIKLRGLYPSAKE